MFVVFTTTQCHNKKSHSVGDTLDTGEEGLNNNEIIISNKEQNLTATEFIRWCADESNSLNKTKDISEFKYNLMYLSPQSMAYLELRTEEHDYARFQKTCDHYTEMTYFNLKIEVPKSSGELLKYELQSPLQYENRIKYISFNMQNDICLVQKGDSLRPGLYQFERIFEVAPYSTVMMAFDNKKFNREKEFTIVFNDKLFDKGYIKFNYKNGQLTNVPHITGL